MSLLQVDPEQRPFMDWVVESVARQRGEGGGGGGLQQQSMDGGVVA